MVKVLSHWPHENVFSQCVSSHVLWDLIMWKNLLLQWSLVNGSPPVCICWWLTIVYILQKTTLLHWSQRNGILRNISSHSYDKDIHFLLSIFLYVYHFLSLPFPENLLSQWLYENNISHFCLFVYLIQKCYYKINTFLSPTK